MKRPLYFTIHGIEIFKFYHLTLEKGNLTENIFLKSYTFRNVCSWLHSNNNMLGCCLNTAVFMSSAVQTQHFSYFYYLCVFLQQQSSTAYTGTPFPSVLHSSRGQRRGHYTPRPLLNPVRGGTGLYSSISSLHRTEEETARGEDEECAVLP